jgi:phosphate acyltransferase
MDPRYVGRQRGPVADERRLSVAVDAMGGDHGPSEVVPGTLEWAREHPETDVILVGEEARIAPFVDGPLPSHVTLVPASELVAMDESPATAVRRKRDASINVAMHLVRSGRADSVVTAGHTGAGVAAAILGLGRLRGVDRPALAIQMVSDKGPFVLLDIGATTDSTALNLLQYARMGTIYAERVFGVSDPSVALLSIGEESGKGEQRIQDATVLLRETDIRFVGNVEGKDLPDHLADVVVCDATVGNVTMKLTEGVSRFILEQFKREFYRPPWGPIGYFFLRGGIRRIRERFDYEVFGGAVLLGVNGNVIITHGRARKRMIGYAVGVGAEAARARIPQLINERLGEREALLRARRAVSETHPDGHDGNGPENVAGTDALGGETASASASTGRGSAP